MLRKILLLVAPILVISSWNVIAAPKAELWPKWQVYAGKQTFSIDHEPWQSFLDKYLHASGEPPMTRVAYSRVAPDDLKKLQDYLGSLQAVDVAKLTKNQQFAFWVNLYNAATVELVLRHSPIDSIKDISFGWFNFGPWDEKFLKVKGEALSLNDIEHRILRPIWKDNRIHYAVNCASEGCPNLSTRAFRPETVEQQLEQAARHYVNHQRGVGFAEGVLKLSKIYDWYSVDFGNNEEQLIEHLKQYAGEKLKTRLEDYKGDIQYRYDWRLNEAH